MNMKKHLVFSFYIYSGWENTFSNKIHLAYLKNFHDVFDSAVFIVVCDNVDDDELISGFEKAIIDIGFVNVEFRVRQNTLFREAKPFYDEVVSKFGDLDGMIMWGHNKGVSNIYFEKAWLFNWLSIMYYGTVGLISDAEKKFVENYYGGEKYFYGAPLVVDKNNPSGSFYGGGFFLMNPGSIEKEMKKIGKQFPKLSNRSYVEEFPGAMFNTDRLGSFRDSVIFKNYSDFYSYNDNDWEDTFNIVFSTKNDIFKQMREEIWLSLES